MIVLEKSETYHMREFQNTEFITVLGPTECNLVPTANWNVQKLDAEDPAKNLEIELWGQFSISENVPLARSIQRPGGEKVIINIDICTNDIPMNDLMDSKLRIETGIELWNAFGRPNLQVNEIYSQYVDRTATAAEWDSIP